MALTKVISKGTVLTHFLLNQTSAQTLNNGVSEIGTLDEARHDTHSFADLSNNRAVFTASTNVPLDIGQSSKFNWTSNNSIIRVSITSGSLRVTTTLGRSRFMQPPYRQLFV